MSRPYAKWFLARLPLTVILLSGAVLRFYRLTAHPLRWDELLVPMASRHSLTYIFNLCATQETHPPLFYLLTKTVLVFSSSDFALRFSSALFGTLCIYILYRFIREFISEGTALLCAALLSVNILHFQLSRELRPYSLHTFLFIFTVWFIARIEKYGRWKDTIFLLCFNGILFSLHYFTYYLVAAQGVVLAILLFKKSCPFTLKQFIVFCAVTAVTAAAVYFLFIQHSLAHQLASEHLPRGKFLRSISTNLWLASFFTFVGPAWATYMYLLPLAGCAVLLFRKPRFAAVCLLLGLIPFALLLITDPGYPLHIWHVIWVTPLVSLCAAMALSWLPGQKLIAPLLAAGCAAYLLIYQHTIYWEAPPERENWKAAAEDLKSTIVPGALVPEAAIAGFASPISWYLDQLPPNPLTEQNLEPGNTPMTIQFAAGGRSSLQQAQEALYVSTVMGEPGKLVKDKDVAVYTFQLNRQPPMILKELPASFVFSTNPKDFYAHVSRLHNVRSVPGTTLPPIYPIVDAYRRMEDGVIATRNNEPDFLEFAFENGGSGTPAYFSATMRYVNDGSGSTIGLWARFDDEPPLLLAESAGPDHNRLLQVNFLRDKPFKRLTLHVHMYCADNTSRLLGENLRTLVFRGLRLDVSQAGVAAAPKPAESVVTPTGPTGPTGTLPASPSW